MSILAQLNLGKLVAILIWPKAVVSQTAPPTIKDISGTVATCE